MNLKDFLPDNGTLLSWVIQAALAVGVISLLAGLIIGVVGNVPVVGPLLAGIIRMLAGNYEKWLTERVPKLAEQAVLSTEEKFRNAPPLPAAERASQKMETALDILKQSAPGLSADQARAQVEAALARIRATGMEQKAR
ncbi:MAG: hypothetical protein K6T57_12320 [Thermaceae bacterium]|nr:hypothetical protein [Thermaceae bacterium]